MKKLKSNPVRPLTRSISKGLHLKSSGINQRSGIGFRTFLENHYIKKSGVGKFRSSNSYLGNLKMCLSIMRLIDYQWHGMCSSQLTQQIIRFHDVDSKTLDGKSIKNINSTLSAYMEYTRYTLGLYNPAAKLAA